MTIRKQKIRGLLIILSILMLGVFRLCLGPEGGRGGNRSHL